ncbi:MAG: sugar-binding protein [Pseudomonadota bacterium]
MIRIAVGIIAACIGGSGVASAATHLDARSEYQAPRAAVAPVVDGRASDRAWDSAKWQSIEHRWLGPEYTPEDFSGRFKVVWTDERLYLLVEITDDILIDSHRNPLVQYWDDDCLEIFIDADHSGGDHQFNHNAFAYHFSLDNRAIDIGTDRQARDYTHHVQSRWQQTEDGLIWEVAIDIYPDNYVDDATDNTPLALTNGEVIGLMVAYCDNDGSELRENFVGSESVPTGPKDRGWIDAGLFGTLILSESEL